MPFLTNPFNHVKLATWNACGLKTYRDEQQGLYYVKNLTQLTRQTKRGYIVALQETRLTQRAEHIIRKRWTAHFTPSQNTIGRGLGFIYDVKLQNTKFGHFLNNTLAYLSYTLNNHRYLYINIHLHSGSELNRKVEHIHQINKGNPVLSFIMGDRPGVLFSENVQMKG